MIAVGPAATGYDVLVGYSQWRGEVKLGASGLKVTLTPTRLSTDASPNASAAMFQADLIHQVPPLAGKAAAGLKLAP